MLCLGLTDGAHKVRAALDALLVHPHLEAVFLEEILELARERRALIAARVRQEEFVVATLGGGSGGDGGGSGGGLAPLDGGLGAVELLDLGQDLLAVNALAYAQLFEVLAGEDGERLAVDVVGDHHLLVLLEGRAQPRHLVRHLLLRPLADVDVVKRRRVRGCARAHAVGVSASRG